MHKIISLTAAAVVAAGFAAPAVSAQVEVQSNPQAERVIGDVVDSLIGGRYRGNERDAVRRCSWAAIDKAERQYRGYFNDRRGFAYPGYRGHVRVTAITDVQRRLLNRVRVRGLLDTGRHNGYGSRWGADLSFRCDTDFRGRVYELKVDRNPHYRPPHIQPVPGRPR